MIDLLWLKEPVHIYEHSYTVLLHILTFLCAIVAAAYTRKLVDLVTGDRDAGFLAGAMLLLTPFWTGYGFFDYKDIPVATGVIAATCYAAAHLQDGAVADIPLLFSGDCFHRDTETRGHPARAARVSCRSGGSAA